MTLLELRKHALMLLRLERAAEDMAEYMDSVEGVDLDAFINDGYRLIILENYPLYKQTRITPDETMEFAVSELAGTGEEVLWIDRIAEVQSGITLNWKASPDTEGNIRLLSGTGAVKVRFKYMPAPLLADTDEPHLPAYAQNLPAYFAAAMAANVGNKSSGLKAQQWLDIFNMRREQLKKEPGDSSANQFINQYSY